MAHMKYDPARRPGDPLYVPASHDPEYDPNIGGPGGRTTNVENNEKGILEQATFRSMREGSEHSPMRSHHDGHRQGIYRTNSVGDFD